MLTYSLLFYYLRDWYLIGVSLKLLRHQGIVLSWPDIEIRDLQVLMFMRGVRINVQNYSSLPLYMQIVSQLRQMYVGQIDEFFAFEILNL